MFGERHIFANAQLIAICLRITAVCRILLAHSYHNVANRLLHYMSTPPAPFTCTYSPQLPELLYQLGCSVALTTYQAGKLIFLSALNSDVISQLPRTFSKPMGIGFDTASGLLALACKSEVVTFANSPDLAQHYPNAPGKYDALFMPRVTYHTGSIDIHDLRFGGAADADKPTFNGGSMLPHLYAVNTLFNCLVTLDASYNFTPYWMPPQIQRVSGDDRCHLNGMAMHEGLPKYATAFGTGNEPGAWRETLLNSGVVYDVTTNEVIADGLGMPHSPKLFDGKLYLLLSATGELVSIDPTTKQREVVCEIGGFVRGMDRIGDYVFVAQSKLRKNSSTFAKLPFAEKANRAGLVVIHLPTGARVGELTYLASVDEIYDVHILPGIRRPNVLNTQKEIHDRGLMTPHSTFWAGQPER